MHDKFARKLLFFIFRTLTFFWHSWHFQQNASCFCQCTCLKFRRTPVPSISPILALIYNESLARGEIPDEWRQANVSPVFKKGEKYDAANYRPVSLTCICCKTLEHILVSNINKHLALDSILQTCWLSAWFRKSEVLRNPVGPVCARYHQQPGWGCESWAQTDRSNHNGFC